MTEKIAEFMNEIIKLLFNCLYIWIIVTAYRYTKYKYQIDFLTKDVKNVKNEQHKLVQIMIKLRNIIKVGDELTNDQTNQIKKIRKEIRKINNILYFKYKKNKLIGYETNDIKEGEDDIKEGENNNTNFIYNLPITLHQQNHITFPNHLVFNQINFKKTKLSNNNHKLEIIEDEIRLISNELSNFLKIETGTCMEFNDAYDMVYKYIQENDIINIGEDSNLCKLFGINENGDYEFTDTMLIEILIQLLEPHFKNII
jgi:hypothetical protein